MQHVRDALARLKAFVVDVKAKLPGYRKSLIAAAGAVAVIAGAVLGETSEEYLSLVAILSTLGVYRVPNAQ